MGYPVLNTCTLAATSHTVADGILGAEWFKNQGPRTLGLWASRVVGFRVFLFGV